MKRLITAATLALIAASASAEPESFTVDGKHSYPVFRVSHLGLTMQVGRFNHTTGKIVIDRAAQTGTIDITVDTASIDMGLDKWDEVMRSEDYFNVAAFPTMTFRSDKVRFDGERVTGAEGELTLLGVTRPFSVKFEGFQCKVNPYNKKHLCGGMATGTLRRSEFGMKKALTTVADEVHLDMAVEAVKD